MVLKKILNCGASNGEGHLEDMNSDNDFWEIWQNQYEELCVLQCQLLGLCNDALPDTIQVGLNAQMNRLFKKHNQLLERFKQHLTPAGFP